MRVHIIDHNSVHIPLIARLIAQTLPALTTLTIAKTSDAHDQFVKGADLVVVSGGRRLLHLNPTTHYHVAKQLVESHKPIFAICLGAQVFAHYFGAKVERLESRVSGVYPVTLRDPSFLPEAQDRILPVYEHHQWAIQALPETLISLADRPEGVELFKHRDLPIWGSQFHPEVRRKGGQGYRAFESVLISLGYDIRS